jgi:hypothetical protein
LILFIFFFFVLSCVAEVCYLFGLPVDEQNNMMALLLCKMCMLMKGNILTQFCPFMLGLAKVFINELINELRPKIIVHKNLSLIFGSLLLETKGNNNNKSFGLYLPTC